MIIFLKISIGIHWIIVINKSSLLGKGGCCSFLITSNLHQKYFLKFFFYAWKIWQWRISCNQYYFIFGYFCSTLFPWFNSRPRTPHTNNDPISVDLSFWLTVALLWSNHQRNREMCWRFLDCFTMGQTFQGLSNIKSSFKYFSGNWAFLQHSFNLANRVKTANKSANQWRPLSFCRTNCNVFTSFEILKMKIFIEMAIVQQFISVHIHFISIIWKSKIMCYLQLTLHAINTLAHFDKKVSWLRIQFLNPVSVFLLKSHWAPIGTSWLFISFTSVFCFPFPFHSYLI